MLRSRPTWLVILWLVASLCAIGAASAQDDSQPGDEPSDTDRLLPPGDNARSLDTRIGTIEPAIDVYDEGAFAYVFAGLSQLDLDSVNDLLEQYGYGRISKTFTQVGTGAFVTVKHWLFGLEYYHLSSNAGDPSPNRASFDGYCTAAHVAFLWSVGSVHIYPILGLGYGSFDLGLVDNDPSLNDVMEGNSRERSVSIDAYLVQAAISAEYLFALSRTEETVRGVLLGLRLGFFFTPLGTRWYLSGVDIDEPPNSNLASAHLSLVLGFGSWSASRLPLF